MRIRTETAIVEESGEIFYRVNVFLKIGTLGWRMAVLGQWMRSEQAAARAALLELCEYKQDAHFVISCINSQTNLSGHYVLSGTVLLDGIKHYAIHAGPFATEADAGFITDKANSEADPRFGITYHQYFGPPSEIQTLVL